MDTPPAVTQGPTLLASLSATYDGPTPADVVERLAQEDYADLRAVVSWRGVVASPDVCHVSLASRYLDLLQRESCGRCGPCRIGTDVMRRLLRRLLSGQGAAADVDSLRELAQRIDDAAWCGIANTVRDPLLGLLDLGAEHFAAHVAGKTCPEEITYGWVTAPCRSTCPSTVDCPSYIFQDEEQHPHLATDIVRRENPLPAVIGRTCHHPCETNCTLAKVGEPIAINFLKRWGVDRALGIVDHVRERGNAGEGGSPDELTERATAQPSQRPVVARAGSKAQKVAIVGAGPAGLAAGYYLARRGYAPVIFESLPVHGGMLYVGIPEYRLPKSVLRREVAFIEAEGVEIRYNQAIGRDVGFADLAGMGFEATFIGIGAHSGKKLRIPGEDLPGSMDAIDFLRQIALGQEVELGDHVLVLGGGNSAMDAARTALRLGVPQVTVVYRRAREQMPANPWEVDEAEEEGVQFHFLAAPLACEGEGCVEVLVCQQMELGPPDQSGRRSPVAVERDPFRLQASTVVAAVGQQPDFSPFTVDPALKLNKWGYLDADPHTGMTAKPGVFVGGDAVTGGASVIEAINAGKVAAKYIDAFLRGEPVSEDLEDRTKRLAVYLGAQRSQYPLAATADHGRRERMPMLAPAVRRTNFAHTELGFTTAQALKEARRCLRCHRPILVAL